MRGRFLAAAMLAAATVVLVGATPVSTGAAPSKPGVLPVLTAHVDDDYTIEMRDPDGALLNEFHGLPAGTYTLEIDDNSTFHNFHLFGPGNVELVVKTLDGRGLNHRFWFFYGALSDVEYDITMTDLTAGKSRTYHNASGNFCGGADTSAF